MSRVALREWLQENRPDVVRKLDACLPADGVSLLNGMTGLNESFKCDPDKICARYLQAFRAERNSMAIAYSQYATNSFSNTTDRYAQSMSGHELAALVRQEEQARTQANSDPEPNPVLLLLGEDE